MPEFLFEGRPVGYREAGEAGAPLVVMAHCSLAHSGMFKPIMAGLADAYRVVSVDMPAHGGTAPPPEGRSLQLWARDACAALIEALGGPAHLVGLSLGGATLGRLAIARPDLARSLTMIEPVWFFLLGDYDRPEWAHENRIMDRVSAAAKISDHAAIREFIDAWGAPGAFEALGPEGQAYAAGCFSHLAKDFGMIMGHPEGQITGEDIAGIRPPVMLLAGAETQVSALGVVDVIAGRLPGARRRIIAGAGHMSPVTHWREVLAEVRAFLDDVETD